MYYIFSSYGTFEIFILYSIIVRKVTSIVYVPFYPSRLRRVPPIGGDKSVKARPVAVIPPKRGDVQRTGGSL